MFKKLLSAVMAASMVFGVVGAAAAAPNGSDFQQAFDFMKGLGCVSGYTDGSAHLDDNLTRAQAATILVNCMGEGATAKLLAGAPAFSDTATDGSGNVAWYSGYVAVAKNKGWVSGFPDGKFHPDEKVTVAQLIMMLDNVLGLNVNKSLGWPAYAIKAAEDAGIVSASDNVAAYADAYASRGAAFFYSNNAFKTPAFDGKNAYQAFVDKSSPVITVNATDAATTETKATISGTVSNAVSLTVNGTAATVAADGSFNVEQALTVGSNEIKLVAVNKVGTSTEKVVTISRTNTEAAGITANGSVTVVAGKTADLGVVVKDKNDAVIALKDAGVTATMSADGLGTFDATTGTFTAGQKAGTGTVTVKVGDFTAAVNVTITAGDLKTVSVTGPSTFRAGTAQKFTVAGADEFGNAVDLTGKTATWAVSPAAAGIIGADGTLIVSNTSAGAVTVTATVDGISGSLNTAAFAQATKLALSTVTNMVANGQGTTTIQASAVDANGNVDTTWNGTINFSSSASAIVAVDDNSKTLTAVNGVATATLDAGKSTGSATITATASGLTTATSIVKTDAQKLTSIKLSTDPGTMAADNKASKAKLHIELDDQTGYPIVNSSAIPSGLTLTISNSNSAVVAPTGGSTISTWQQAKPDDGVNYNEKDAIELQSQGSVGSSVISATVTGPSAYTNIPVSSATISTVTNLGPSKLAIDSVSDVTAGDDRSVTVRVLDINGNQSTASDSDVTITVKATDSDGNSKSYTAAATKTGSATIKVLGKDIHVAGAVQLKATATYGSGNLAEATATYNVVAGKANKLTLTATPSSLNPDGVSQSTLKVAVSDAYGNDVTDGAYAVKITKFADNKATAAFTDTTVNTVNGVASVTVTATKNNAVTDTYRATATGLGLGEVTISTAVMGAPAKVNISIPAADLKSAKTADANAVYKSVTAGDDKTVAVQVYDAAGTAVTNDNGRTVTLTVKDSDGNVVNTLTGTVSNGVAKITVNETTVDTYTVSATADGLTSSDGVDLPINAASAAGLKIVPGRATLSADGTSSTPVKVYAVDTYGNKTTAPDTNPDPDVTVSATVSISLSDSSLGKLDHDSSDVNLTTTGGDGGKFTFTTKNGTHGGTETLTVTDKNGALTSGTATITVVAAGSPTHIGVAAVESAAADGATQQAVVVNMYDASNNPVTNTAAADYELVVSGQNTAAAVTVQAKKADGTYYPFTPVSETVDGKTVLHYNTSDFGTKSVAGVAGATYDGAGGAYSGITAGTFTFYVMDTTAETLTYTIKPHKVAGGTLTVDGDNYKYVTSGSFTALSAKALANATGTVYVIGDGYSTTQVVVNVIDNTDASKGNIVEGASGNVNFEIESGNDFATLVTTSAPVVNGKAEVTLQTKNVTNSAVIKIKASTTDILNSAGSALSSIEFSTVTVDHKAPVIGDTEGNLTVNTKLTITSATGTVSGSLYTYVAQPLFSIAAADNNTENSKASDTFGSGVASVQYQYREKGVGSWTDIGDAVPAPKTGSADVWELTGWGDTAELPAGTYEFRAVVTDKAGNETDSAVFTVEIKAPQ